MAKKNISKPYKCKKNEDKTAIYRFFGADNCRDNIEYKSLFAHKRINPENKVCIQPNLKASKNKISKALSTNNLKIYQLPQWHLPFEKV